MKLKEPSKTRQEHARFFQHVRMLVDSDSSILFKNVQKRSKTLHFFLDTCILFWAKVLPQHESTVWLLMSYFACGSMSQLLSESKSSDMLVVSRISWLLMYGINFAKSPSTFACFCDSMKAMINSKCAILPSEQRLVYNTTLLEDSVLLADFLPEALRSYKAQILQLNKT